MLKEKFADVSQDWSMDSLLTEPPSCQDGFSALESKE